MLKIGNLLFHKKALLNLSACFFLIGLPIGILVAFIQDTGTMPSPVLLVFGLMVYNLGCFFYFVNRIKKNVKDSSAISLEK